MTHVITEGPSPTNPDDPALFPASYAHVGRREALGIPSTPGKGGDAPLVEVLAEALTSGNDPVRGMIEDAALEIEAVASLLDDRIAPLLLGPARRLRLALVLDARAAAAARARGGAEAEEGGGS